MRNGGFSPPYFILMRTEAKFLHNEFVGMRNGLRFEWDVCVREALMICSFPVFYFPALCALNCVSFQGPPGESIRGPPGPPGPPGLPGIAAPEVSLVKKQIFENSFTSSL